MMTKFYVGQKVLVTGSTYIPCPATLDMIGTVCEVKRLRDNEGQTAIWNSDKTEWGNFNDRDFHHITETQEEITVNGVTYVRKPEPEHEWKFGDVAINKVGKVGIIVRVLYDKTLDFYYNEGRSNAKVSPTELTFLRRADLSNPENKTFNPGDQIYTRKAYAVYGVKATVLEKTDGGYKVKFEDGSISDIPDDRISATII